MLCSPSSGCVTGTQARLSAPLQTSHIVAECKFTQRLETSHENVEKCCTTDQVPPLSRREPSIIFPGSELEFGVHVARLKMFVLRWRSGFVHTRKISYTSHEEKNVKMLCVSHCFAKGNLVVKLMNFIECRMLSHERGVSQRDNINSLDNWRA